MMNLPFLEQFEKYKTSRKIALIGGGTTLTYAQLYERSLALASRLRSLGVGMHSTAPEHYDIYHPKASPHSPWVIIVSNRSPDAVVGVIAAWMAGGAFVLTEQSAPGAYIDSLVEDTAAAAVIRDATLSGLSESAAFTCGFPQKNDIACAVFTSGSTGKPKGAVLEHRVISEMLAWQTAHMNPARITATAAYAPLGFIAALWELFYPLYNGLTLHMLDETTRHDLFALENYIEKNQIAYLFLPPNIAEIFTQTYKGKALKYLRVAGGRLNACGNPAGGYEIMYHLGMSENGGSVTFKPITTAMSGEIPIGKAWHNTKVRLDASTGEMIVSGPSLFRGYLARKDETQRKRFDGEYHSGDLARIDENGELIHRGRNDLMIKIRDMKVSPLQIECVLLACEGVSECCVTAQEDTLVAWFTGRADETSLRTALSARLPEYMIPARFVRLEKMPRNRNGKIDRPALVFVNALPAGTLRADEAETEIADMFARILGLPARSVGADDSFWRLGGDSLKLIRLQAEIARAYSQNVPYAALFENPTPRGVESLLRNQGHDTSRRIPPAPQSDAYPLSAPMRQMWLLWRTGQDRGKYTVSIRCRFNGEIDHARVISSFAELVRRNAILRSRFVMRGGDAVQIVENSMDVSIGKQARQVFDLTKTPLFDITLADSTLVFTTHHIVADATGLRVLMEDFWTLYGGAQPPKAAQAHDITMWAPDENTPANESFWMDMLSGKTSARTLPYDRKRPDRLTCASRETITFNESEAARLREYAAHHNATLFQLFLSAYALLLAKLTGENPVIGIPFAGREHPDTARTIGMLVRTLPVRAEVFGMSLDEALAHIRKRFVSAWENQNISLERLMEMVDGHRTGARNPFYDVMINYVPLPLPLPDTEGLCPQILRGEYPAALFDLVLDLREETDGLSAVFTYADELFGPETIRRWLDALKTLLLTHELKLANACAVPDAKKEENPDFDEATSHVSELMRVWKDVLGTEPMLPGDDFFTFGGTSLAAIRMEAALFERGWILSAADILQNPKPHEMAALIVPAEDIDWEEES